jgi:hypothetical protein
MVVDPLALPQHVAHFLAAFLAVDEDEDLAVVALDLLDDVNEPEGGKSICQFRRERERKKAAYMFFLSM